jgi:hypothetical protein
MGLMVYFGGRLLCCGLSTSHWKLSSSVFGLLGFSGAIERAGYGTLNKELETRTSKRLGATVG